MSKKQPVLPGIVASEDPERERVAVFRVEVPFYGRASHEARMGGKLAMELTYLFGPRTVVRPKKDSAPYTPLDINNDPVAGGA